jgi:tetratricopeptide (TPR) repeat protein
LGWIYVTKRQFEKAIVEGERAVGTSPNGADIHFGAAIIFMFYGTPNEAIILAKKAMRLNPIPPVGYFNILGVSYRESKQYEESISLGSKRGKFSRSIPGSIWNNTPRDCHTRIVRLMNACSPICAKQGCCERA